ncbi:hypothetical protein BKA64DRAFT_698990 [Cadophora sp. MPI-SDFR-AT-0126]|nr:hypothetical protein BKA64DRAFT_698990 [Leotiomycetes sp. MPI-SDFR-AT-0126]
MLQVFVLAEYRFLQPVGSIIVKDEELPQLFALEKHNGLAAYSVSIERREYIQYSVDMENDVLPLSCNGRTGNNAKTALQSFRGQYNQQSRSDASIGQEEPTSYPNTPPLTLNTGSTSSSIVICEGSGGCGGLNSQCTCLGHSDTESVRNQGSESDAGFPRSPITYPAYRLNSCAERSDAFAKRRANWSQSPELGVRVFSPGGTSLQADSTRVRSRLMNDTALSPPNTESGVDIIQDNSDFNDSGSDEDEDDDDASDEDDSWSGQDSRVEAIILEAVGEDLELAAFLIPFMHRAYHSEINAYVKQKVGPWCQAQSKCSPGGDGVDGSGMDQTPSSTAQSNESPPSSRKRQRTSGSTRQIREPDGDGDEDDEDEDEDDNQDSKEMGDHAGNGSPQPVRRLACPFFKREPSKYCTQLDTADSSNNNYRYRVCEGPGFKNIQRLKEHIKRKHYPVQCDRCYELFTFSGSDRAAGVRALQTHRQLPQPCERRDSRRKEGISEAQCADLDKKKNAKKSQSTSSVEKYWEIWEILFPGISRPATPWYDGSSSSRRASRLPQAIRFCATFNRMLTHQVIQQNIRFEPGLEDEMRSRVENLVETAFSVFLGLEGLPSSTNTSSSRSAIPPTSYLSESYDNVSDPRRTNRWSSSTHSRSSIARSHGFTDVQDSSPANPSMTVPTHHAAMPPQYLHNNPMQISPQSFAGPMNVPPNLQAGVSGFQLGLQPNMPFPGNSFDDNNGSHSYNSGHYMYGVAFTNANSNFNSDNTAANYVASNTQDLGQDWDHITAPRRADYNGSQ